MVGVVPDWDQTGKQKPDEVTVQSQGSNSRMVMQVQTCLQPAEQKCGRNVEDLLNAH